MIVHYHSAYSSLRYDSALCYAGATNYDNQEKEHGWEDWEFRCGVLGGSFAERRRQQTPYQKPALNLTGKAWALKRLIRK